MRRFLRMMPTLVVAGALTAGCASGVSDTGYVGTWSKGNERNTSTISIARVGDEYLFRWVADSLDGRWKVRSGWDGRCEEWIGGTKVADWRFRAWKEPDTGLLRVEAKVREVDAEDWRVLYVDELVLAREGLALKSFTLVRDGEEKNPPPLFVFDKVSDEVLEPPPPGMDAG